LISICIK